MLNEENDLNLGQELAVVLAVKVIVAIVFVFFVYTVQGENMSNSKIEMQTDKVSYYTQILKKKFLETLVKNGYKDGYDFNKSKVEVQLNTNYLSPTYNGGVNYKDDLVYVPAGVKFDYFFAVDFIEFEGKLQIRLNDRKHYMYHRLKGTHEEVDALTSKGPYPGSKYFAKELKIIDSSLKKHKPSLVVDEYSRVKVNLQNGMQTLTRRGVSFYQLDKDRVLIVLLVDENPSLYIGVRFVYNIVTGVIEKQENMSPPALI